MSYFLVAVSTRVNVDLCVRHALAGFTDSISGLWTFLDIQQGDFISFLYGANVHNLYEVVAKLAYKDAHTLPPWPPLVLRPSGRTYHFPFRLEVKPVRALVQPLVRAEFAYVAENLLLRGGYRKTHFQADQTTLQNVSEMGVPHSGTTEPLDVAGAETFIPCFVRQRKDARPPHVFALSELVVQSLLRRYLSVSPNLQKFLEGAGIEGLDASKLEVLGEKAFPEGHVDILIKEAVPIGMGWKVVVEVKRRAASSADVEQLRLYMDSLGEECAGAILVAGDFGKRIREKAAERGIGCATYTVAELGDAPMTYDTLFSTFDIAPAGT